MMFLLRKTGCKVDTAIRGFIVQPLNRGDRYEKWNKFREASRRYQEELRNAPTLNFQKINSALPLTR